MTVKPSHANLDDPLISAKAAGLRYVTDERPGLVRKGAGKGFRYVAHNGKGILSLNLLVRIKALAIPPA
ncbi:MAG: hypothetical protein ABI618_20300 [Nitrospirota bacterium]